jgi:lipoprotein NlpI
VAAIGDFSEALKLDPELARAWCLRGYGHLIQLDFGRALSDFNRAIQLGLSTGHEDSARLRAWVARSRLGEINEATRDLKAHFEKRASGESTPWTLRIAAFLCGEVPEKEFLAGIEGAPAAAASYQACERWYFAGQKRRLTGDVVGARSAFENAVASNAKGVSAWSAARSEILAAYLLRNPASRTDSRDLNAE